jgi:hypothetical protein
MQQTLRRIRETAEHTTDRETAEHTTDHAAEPAIERRPTPPDPAPSHRR